MKTSVSVVEVAILGASPKKMSRPFALLCIRIVALGNNTSDPERFHEERDAILWHIIDLSADNKLTRRQISELRNMIQSCVMRNPV